MFASLAAVFGGLVLAKQANASDTRWLMTDDGLKAFGLQIYLPVLALAVVSWMCLRSRWNVARPALASVICYLGRAAVDNEEVINYFIADLLRYYETGFVPPPKPSSGPAEEILNEPTSSVVRLLPAIGDPHEPVQILHLNEVAESRRVGRSVAACS